MKKILIRDHEIEFSKFNIDQSQDYIEQVIKANIQSLNSSIDDTLFSFWLFFEECTICNVVTDNLVNLSISLDHQPVDLGLVNLVNEINEYKEKVENLFILINTKFGKLPLDTQHPKYKKIRIAFQTDDEFKEEYRSIWTSFYESVIAIADAYENILNEIVILRKKLDIEPNSKHLIQIREDIQSLKNNYEQAHNKLLALLSHKHPVEKDLDNNEQDHLDTNRSEEDFEQYVKDLIDGWIEAADVGEEIKLLVEALAELETQGIEENSVNETLAYKANVEVGIKYEAIGEYVKANQHFSSAMELTNFPSNLYFWRGQNHFRLNMFDEAKADLLHALDLSESKKKEFSDERSMAKDLLDKMDKESVE